MQSYDNLLQAINTYQKKAQLPLTTPAEIKQEGFYIVGHDPKRSVSFLATLKHYLQVAPTEEIYFEDKLEDLITSGTLPKMIIIPGSYKILEDNNIKIISVTYDMKKFFTDARIPAPHNFKMGQTLIKKMLRTNALEAEVYRK